MSEIVFPSAYATHQTAGSDTLSDLVDGYTAFTLNHDGDTSGTTDPATGLTWYMSNIKDLRAMIGKKIRIYANGINNGHAGKITAGVLSEATPLMNIDSSTLANTRPYQYTPSMQRTITCYPADAYHNIDALTNGCAIADGQYAEMECKLGTWNGRECIYWERTDSGKLLNP